MSNSRRVSFPGFSCAGIHLSTSMIALSLSCHVYSCPKRVDSSSFLPTGTGLVAAGTGLVAGALDLGIGVAGAAAGAAMSPGVLAAAAAVGVGYASGTSGHICVCLAARALICSYLVWLLLCCMYLHRHCSSVVFRV